MEEEKKRKNILILKATSDVCGSEVGLISNHCQLLGMNVYMNEIESEESLYRTIYSYSEQKVKFDYLYLCTHGNTDCFLVNMAGEKYLIKWSKFAQLICEREILNPETILLLACCKGGFFQVASDILSVCNSINFVCGVKWSVKPWDLTTGFIVFIHNIEIKDAEPSYAASKASLATDYTFVCYDRDEVETNPQYENRRYNLFLELGWINKEGDWIETDPTITENVHYK